MPQTSCFKDSWLSDELYKNWIRRKSDTIAFCIYWHKTIDIANGGESALKCHARVVPFPDKREIHKQKSPVATGNNLKMHMIKTVEVSDTEKQVQSPTSSQKQVQKFDR